MRKQTAGECIRCGSPWPYGEKRCPDCGWDGESMDWLSQVPPEMMKPLREGEAEHHTTLARRRR